MNADFAHLLRGMVDLISDWDSMASVFPVQSYPDGSRGTTSSKLSPQMGTSGYPLDSADYQEEVVVGRTPRLRPASWSAR